MDSPALANSGRVAANGDSPVGGKTSLRPSNIATAILPPG